MFCRYALPEGVGGPAGLWSPLAGGPSAAACPAGFGGPGSTPASLWWDHSLHCCSSQLHTPTHITDRQWIKARVHRLALSVEKARGGGRLCFPVAHRQTDRHTDRHTDRQTTVSPLAGINQMHIVHELVPVIARHA